MNPCDECDYVLAFCDGDPLMCASAKLYGWNSEQGRPEREMIEPLDEVIHQKGDKAYAR